MIAAAQNAHPFFSFKPVAMTITKQYDSIVLISENGPARPGILSEIECGVKVESGLRREAEGGNGD